MLRAMRGPGEFTDCVASQVTGKIRAGGAPIVIRFAADENLNDPLVRAVQRRRPDIDLGKHHGIARTTNRL